MFVRTARGELVPLASFERFWTAEDDGQSREHGRLSNGATEELAAGEIERVAESGARPFPAAPDTFVLQEVLDEHDRLSLERVPVLGWVLSPLRAAILASSAKCGEGGSSAGGMHISPSISSP